MCGCVNTIYEKTKKNKKKRARRGRVQVGVGLKGALFTSFLQIIVSPLADDSLESSLI